MAKVIVVGGKPTLDRDKFNMGSYLVKALLDLGIEVACVRTSTAIYKPTKAGWKELKTFSTPDLTVEGVAAALDEYAAGVDAIMIATPSSKELERPYVDYALKNGMYVETIAKDLLAWEWQKYMPHLHRIGRYGAVGGRSLPIPILQLQQLQGKKYHLYAYLNATVECFFSGTRDLSLHEMYRVVKALKLAEPESEDYVSCVNVEISGDYVRKIPILVNDALIGNEGPYMTPAVFDDYVPLKPEHIREIRTRGQKFALCISSNTEMPLDVKKGTPGTLSASFRGLTILGGFCDPRQNVDLDGWMQGGAKNGVKLIFQNGTNESGKVESVGEGAGPDTVWSAILNLREHLRAAGGSRVREHAIA